MIMQNYYSNKKTRNHYSKRGFAERVVLTSIALSAAAVVTSLFVYFRPFTMTDVGTAAKNLYSFVNERINDIQERRRERIKEKEEQLAAAKRAELLEKQEALSPPYGGKRALDSTGQPLFVDRSVLSGIGQSGVPFSQLFRIRADHGDKKLQLCDSDKAHRRGQESGSVSDPSVSGCGRQRRDLASQCLARDRGGGRFPV